MPISIGANIAALQAQRRLGMATDQLGRTYSQLSSGVRITTAGDDAAGLSVADTLRSQRAMTRAAERNANDAISMIAIADGGLLEVSNILSRMGELANQSANGTLSTKQRSALSDEFSALWYEWDRLVNTTTFNSINVLASGLTQTIQVGIDNSTNSTIDVRTVSAIPYTVIGAIPASGVNTAANAQATIDKVKNALSTVSAMRGSFGAVESRIRSAINNLQVAGENFASAESRIRDVDVADASANLTRLTILQQAGAAVLAQANQAPQLALSLLG